MEKTNLNPSEIKVKLLSDITYFLKNEAHTIERIHFFFRNLQEKYFKGDKSSLQSFFLSLSQEKTSILFLRHGQSAYNKWRENSYCNLPCFYRNKPMNYDPKLTEMGQKQALEAIETILANPVDRLYVSPLKRTLQTCLPIEESLRRVNPDLKVQAIDLIRERMDYPCDIGSSKQQLVEEFGQRVDFGLVSRDKWWRWRDKYESMAFNKEKKSSESKRKVYPRVLLFVIMVLLEEGGKNILMVSHQNIYQCLFRNYKLFAPKIENCEVQRLTQTQLEDFMRKAISVVMKK